MVLGARAHRPCDARVVAQVVAARARHTLCNPICRTRGSCGTGAVGTRALLDRALAVLRCARSHRLVLRTRARRPRNASVVAQVIAARARHTLSPAIRRACGSNSSRAAVGTRALLNRTLAVLRCARSHRLVLRAAACRPRDARAISRTVRVHARRAHRALRCLLLAVGE